MNDYIKREDAVEQVELQIPFIIANIETPRRTAERIIGSCPSTDVVEVVKCKNCIYLRSYQNQTFGEQMIKLGYIGFCNHPRRHWDVDCVKLDDYCSKGERRSDE